MKISQAIEAFRNESFDLVQASEETVLAASEIVGGDIHARWMDYKEELLAELMM